MKYLLTLLLFISTAVIGKTIATCQNPEGHAYYPYTGMTTENKSGWDKDAITGGITQLNLNDDGSLDIQFVDASKQIISAKSEGGITLPFATNKNTIGVATVYSGAIIETYMFTKDGNGKLEFMMTQSKVNSPIPKASALRGSCTYIDFDTPIYKEKNIFIEGEMF